MKSFMLLYTQVGVHKRDVLMSFFRNIAPRERLKCPHYRVPKGMVEFCRVAYISNIGGPQTYPAQYALGETEPKAPDRLVS